MTTTPETFQRALQCHQASQWSEAEQLYRAILADEPRHIDAQHLLGLLELQTGRAQDAAARIAAALAILAASGVPATPAHAALHVNLGTALNAIDRRDEAAASYRRALGLDPTCIQAHANLGNLLEARGDLAGAIASYREALRLDPDFAQAHYSLGNAYAANGRIEDAIASYRDALQRRPDYAEALNNLANMLQTAGRLDAAVEAYQAAIRLAPRSVTTLVNLGVALRAARRLDEAVACYERALALDPNAAQAHYNLANARYAQGAWDAAEAGYRRATTLEPGYADAHFNLGNLLKERGDVDQAMARYRLALAADPKLIGARFNLANLLQDQERFDDAIGHWQDLLAVAPDHAEAHASLGNALHAQGRITDALAAFGRALALKPDLAEAHYNNANALEDDGQIASALAHYQRAIELRPEYVEAHWNRSLTLLRAGDFAAGWPEYEWRWRRRYSETLRRPFTQPRWRGEPLDGRRILLHAEQGMGDTLQFCRYVELVAAHRPAEIILEVPPPLLGVMVDSFAPAGVRVVPMDPQFPRADSLPPFDLHCPLMSLPLALGTTLETIPARLPYLTANAAKVAVWQRRLAAVAGPRIGLVWAGGIRPNDPQAVATDRRRSLALAALAPLAAVGDVSWVSLQKGPPASQAAEPPAGMALIDPMEEVTDFADTAAVVMALDLVISVDTSVAHLAGGLGKPVWLLSRFDGCWRWLLNRDDSPWYPTMRLYRQLAASAWTPVIARLADDLKAWRRTLPPAPAGRPAENRA
ncbi:MAG: tetratricopeptide repeat protein [Proteobacteria bacterium]|nr:tetratricopeptide repeat protein [Pseudomonadota bacterium]